MAYVENTKVGLEDLQACCGSKMFAAELAKHLPFSSLAEAVELSRVVWWNQVNIPGWLEAFSAHPRIGDVEALRKKFSSTSQWCEVEQAAALETANKVVLQELAEWNRRYETKFGFIFILCATGKSSSEVLGAIKARLSNRPITEIQVAAEEQQKITELRLAKLISASSSASSAKDSSLDAPPVSQKGSALSEGVRTSFGRRLEKIGAHVTSSGTQQKPETAGSALRPPITTHVLDVSLGKPASGIHVALMSWREFNSVEPRSVDSYGASGNWIVIGTSMTNDDGRSGALMEPANQLLPGRYQLVFGTKEYFLRTQRGGFYPHVAVIFEVDHSQVYEHFHVPVLLAPFSYSTYRGS